MKSAIQAGVQLLFHYQPFDVSRIEHTLVQDRIYFSKPSAFNDPWDCRPAFSKRLLDDAKIYERHVEYFSDLGHRVLRLPPEEVGRRARRLSEDRAFMLQQVDELTHGIQTAIEEKYRVYCLSTRNDSILMWGHYARNHTGVCFGFRTSTEAFCGALSVEYSPSYPAIDMTDDDEMLFVRQTLCTKAQDWSYENEFRLVAKEGESEGFVTVEGGFLNVGTDALERVIVGCLMSPDNVDQVLRMARTRAKPVPVYRACRVAEFYNVSLEQIA